MDAALILLLCVQASNGKIVQKGIGVRERSKKGGAPSYLTVEEEF